MSKTPMPPHNPTPAGAFTTPSEVVAPRQIGWAVKLIWVAAILQGAAAILGIINISSTEFRSRTYDAVQKLGVSGNIDEFVDRSIQFSMVSAIGGGIVSVLLYLLIARFIGKGALWARLAGGVFAIAALTKVPTLVMPEGVITIAQILVGLTAIVLCYIKPGSTYFRDKQVARIRSKQR